LSSGNSRDGARLPAHGVVCLERSIETMVAILAMLKARAPFLPLDPD
jgi:non-ribosomal peptide synthetase component F